MTTEARRDEGPRHGLVFLLAALTMIGPFAVDTIFPGFPQVGAELGADPVALQQILSVYLVSFAVMSLVHGPLSDAMGRRPVILGGLGLFALTSVWCAVAPSMPLLLVGRALQGLVAGGGMIVARTVVRDVFSGDRAQRAMSQMSMIFGVAPALAPIVGGWLLGWSTWRSVFWFLAVFAVVLFLALLFLLPETHPPARRTPLEVRALAGALRDAVRDPGVRRLLGVSSFNFAALFTYISAAPAIVVTILHLGPGDFGWLFVPVVTAMIFGSWLTGRLAGRISSATFIALGFGCAVVGAVIGLALDAWGVVGLPWALVAPTTAGLGIALVFPIVTLALLDLRPRHRGTLSSAQSCANTLLNAVIAGAIVPLVNGSLVTLTLTALAFSLLGWAVWEWHRRVAHPRLETPPDPGSYEPTDRM